jgi:hypothetical protein
VEEVLEVVVEVGSVVEVAVDGLELERSGPVGPLEAVAELGIAGFPVGDDLRPGDIAGAPGCGLESRRT